MSGQENTGNNAESINNDTSDSAPAVDTVGQQEGGAAQHQQIAHNYIDDTPKFLRIAVDRWIELAFTAAIVVATIVNVCIANRQTQIASKQTIISEQQLNIQSAEQRPWLSIEGASISVPSTVKCLVDSSFFTRG